MQLMKQMLDHIYWGCIRKDDMINYSETPGLPPQSQDKKGIMSLLDPSIDP